MKRRRCAVEAAFDELVCPITQGFPVDPVTAEDGRIYERAAITTWLHQTQRSPWTNQPMGPTLLPALHIKNMLQRMIESGSLEGDRAEAWLTSIRQADEVAKVRAKAMAGHGRSMYNLGRLYSLGLNGLPLDVSEAYRWWSKSHEAGHKGGTAGLGYCLLLGKGVERDSAVGLTRMVQAAEQGSGYACCFLGFFFGQGILPGIPKNDAMAKEFFRRMLSSSCEDATDQMRALADRALAGLGN